MEDNGNGVDREAAQEDMKQGLEDIRALEITDLLSRMRVVVFFLFLFLFLRLQSGQQEENRLVWKPQKLKMNLKIRK